MSTTTISDQARMLAERVGVRTRDDLVVLRLRGDDQRSWLNGQVTNDVRDTKPGDGVYCLAVDVRGKIMTDLWAVDDGERLSLILPALNHETLIESLESQIIMEDVELEIDRSIAVLSVQGPLAQDVVSALSVAESSRLEVYRGDELGHGGSLLLVPSPDLPGWRSRLVLLAEQREGAEISEEAFELARLRAGRPRLGTDFGAKNYPQEAGLKALAVSFNKGCYLGQEVVCTLENRGKLSRALMRLDVVSGTAAPQDEIVDAAGKVVGHITSIASDPERGRPIALGYLKTAAAREETALSTAHGGIAVLGPVGK